MKLFPDRIKRELKEMTTRAYAGLRNNLDVIKGGFFQAPSTAALRNTTVDYEQARALYYNTNTRLNNGAFFAKPIVDGVADHIGLPIVTLQDENTDQLVNHFINDVWSSQLWEMYRNSLRDTKAWVRLRQPFPSKLLATDEENDVTLEILDAENVTPYYNPVTKELSRVEIALSVYIEEANFTPDLVAATGARVYGREHNLIEIITPDEYMYYDKTTGHVLDEFTTTNSWGFIPLVEVFNDFDSTLNGGSSELENPYPFFQALHDLVIQTRTAHGYHSDPKVKFKLDDVMNFLRNNFAESFDSEGKFSGNVSWKGRDVYFMESEEDIGFIQADLNTTDSVSLMEFVIDCICTSAEVTQAVLFRSGSVSSDESDEMLRFKKKIDRKRNNYADAIQKIVKMALVISTGSVQKVPSVSWLPIQTSDLVAEGTAMNQIITAAEVANRAGAISLVTYRGKIRQFFPHMKDNDDEMQQAQKEQAADQQTQLDFEKKMLALNPGKSTNGNGGGPNGARGRLPMDIVPISKGN